MDADLKFEEVKVFRGKRLSGSGLSLVETVTAAAILLAAFLLFTRLFVFGLRGVSRAGQVATNVARAESLLGELESLAAQNRWSELVARHGQIVDAEGVLFRIEVLEPECFSPSTSWESPFQSLGTSRSFSRSMVQATVRVDSGSSNFSLTRLVSRPRLALAEPPIELLNVPLGPLNANAEATLRARLLAKDGTEIAAAFQWYVIPGSGTGTLTPSRNGRDAVFRNSSVDSSGRPILTGGDCQIGLRTIYFGEEIRFTSPRIGLNK